MLRRDGSPVSATTTLREQTNPHQLLGDLAARYHDAVTAGAENLIGTTGMDKIDAHAEALLDRAHRGPRVAHTALPPRAHRARRAQPPEAAHRTPSASVRWPTPATPPRCSTPASTTSSPNSPPPGHTTRTLPPPPPGRCPGCPASPPGWPRTYDWGPFAAAYHQLVREQIDAVREQARGLDRRHRTGLGTALPRGRGHRPAGRSRRVARRRRHRRERPAPHRRPHHRRPRRLPGQAQPGRPRRHVRATPSPSAPGTRRCPRPSAHDPWITPLCQRLARLERAGLPVTDYIKQALATDPSLTGGHSGTDTDAETRPRGRCPTSTRPPRCGGAWFRTSGRPHSAPTSTPRTCCSPPGAPHWPNSSARPRPTTCRRLPPGPRSSPRSTRPASTTAGPRREILSSALAGVPQDGSLTGVEVADALVLRIAMLTDQPTEAPPPGDDEAPYPDADVPADPDLLPPEDADEFMAAFYRDQPDDTDAPVFHSPTPDEYDDLAAEPVDRAPPRTSPTRRRTTTSRSSTTRTSRTRTRRPCRGSRPTRSPPRTPSPTRTRSRPSGSTSSTSRPWPTTSPATRARGRRTTCASGSGPTSPTTPTTPVGYAPGGGRSLMRHLTDQGATLDELEQAGLVSQRERNDGTTYYRDFFRDRLVMPIRDPHDPDGRGDPRLRRPPQPHQDRRRLRRTEVPQHPHHPHLHQGRGTLRVRRSPRTPRRRRAPGHRRRPHGRAGHHPGQQRRRRRPRPDGHRAHRQPDQAAARPHRPGQRPRPHRRGHRLRPRRVEVGAEGLLAPHRRRPRPHPPRTARRPGPGQAVRDPGRRRDHRRHREPCPRSATR